VKSSFCLVFLAIFLFMSIPSLPIVFAQGVVDQKQESYDVYASLTANVPVGQEFVPSLPLLVGVDVLLYLYPADTITLRIRESSLSGEILVEVSALIPENFFGWFHFNFPSVHVTPGSTYMIQLTATDSFSSWGMSESNPYPNGVSYVSGNPHPIGDFAFRTYGVTLPVGGTLVPVSEYKMLAPFLGLLSLVIGTVTVTFKRRKA